MLHALGLALGGRRHRAANQRHRPDRQGRRLVSIVIGGVTFAFGFTIYASPSQTGRLSAALQDRGLVVEILSL